MKARLTQIVVVTTLSATAGAAIAIWQKSDHLAGIVIVAAVVGLIFGSFFKFKLV